MFVNSVLGARTDRYGDFIDICAALTGRVPNAGLHRDEHRRARVVFQLSGIPDEVLRSEILFPSSAIWSASAPAPWFRRSSVYPPMPPRMR